MYDYSDLTLEVPNTRIVVVNNDPRVRNPELGRSDRCSHNPRIAVVIQRSVLQGPNPQIVV